MEEAENIQRPEKEERAARRRMVDLDDNLITAAAARYTGTHNHTPTNREIISLAVAEFLPLVIERLVHAGVTARPTGRRRPRNLDISTWQLLLDAESQVALEQIQILRCCLVLAARSRSK